MNLFFSYTTRDGTVDVARLRRVAKSLESFATPYIDLLEHRNGGHQPSVWKALQGADALLVCLTPGVSQSPWVWIEYLAALKRGLPVYMASMDRWLSPDHSFDLQSCLLHSKAGLRS